MPELDQAVTAAQIKWLKLHPAKKTVEVEDGIAYLYRDGVLFGMMNADDFRRLREGVGDV